MPPGEVTVKRNTLDWPLVIAPERAANWPEAAELVCTTHGALPPCVHGRAVNPPDSKPSVKTCGANCAVTFTSLVTVSISGFVEATALPVQPLKSKFGS